MVCFSVFTITQIPTALSQNVGQLIGWRTVSGFFGSVGVANGGGTISDMFEPSQRAAIFGWYLLGPLLGPTLGPLFGGLIVANLNWRWIFWILTIICVTNTVAGFLFLRETYAPVILAARKKSYEEASESGSSKVFRVADEDNRPFRTKFSEILLRPLRILFTQPIVLVLAVYQAVLFGTTYSLYTNFQAIYSDIYGFGSTQVGLLYLFPGLGFLIAVWFLVPNIDTVYNRLAEKNDGKAKPEYRLPLANIGAALLPISLFWFAWTVEYHAHVSRHTFHQPLLAFKPLNLLHNFPQPLSPSNNYSSGSSQSSQPSSSASAKSPSSTQCKTTTSIPSPNTPRQPLPPAPSSAASSAALSRSLLPGCSLKSGMGGALVVLRLRAWR